MNKIRCVHIFPRFEYGGAIDEIRKKYDYLHDCIEPHITLVFPFESDLSSEEIIDDLRNNLSGIDAFKVTAKNIEGVDDHGYYLFLNIDEGSNKISELHYKLHKGLLAPYQSQWTLDGSYKPHITIGRFVDKAEMELAAAKYLNFSEAFSSYIDRVIVEVIGDNEESIIEGEVVFGEMQHC